MAMRNRLRLLAAPVLALAVVTMGLTVAAPNASAAGSRQVYEQVFSGPPSVTVPQCKAAGQALVAAGRFDFYRCVTLIASGPNQSEELEGFLIIG
jgi:hypothetical protein